jgi:hypothetical protein
VPGDAQQPRSGPAPVPAVLDVHLVALQEIDRVVGNEMQLGPAQCAQLRGILSAALSQRHRS